MMYNSNMQRVGVPVATAFALVLALGAMPVQAADSGTPHSDTIGAAITDTAITAQVKAKMVGDDQLKNTDVSVKTTNGVVTLTGTAPTSDAKRAAERTAADVNGVKSVDNQIVTGGSHAGQVASAKIEKAERVGSDAWITTKVKSSLIADDVGRGLKLNVTTMNGVVNLNGSVPNQDARDHVKDMAGKIDGVKSVDTSGLTIERKPE
jgi:hyperosmotically inducible protein